MESSSEAFQDLFSMLFFQGFKNTVLILRRVILKTFNQRVFLFAHKDCDNEKSKNQENAKPDLEREAEPDSADAPDGNQGDAQQNSSCIPTSYSGAEILSALRFSTVLTPKRVMA
jgi:hypothetical protein